MRYSILLSISLTLACGGAGTGPCNAPINGEREALIDHDLWRVAGAHEDPWASHRPGVLTCPDWGHGREGSTYEVNTGDCNYITLVQETKRRLCTGTSIEAVFWHLPLWAAEPTQGHVSITLGTTGLLDETLEIPGNGNSYTPRITLDRNLAAGTPIRLHIHNHGRNDWTLLEVVALADESP
jgi:hypothetical protein